jgi:hypothetical protein
MDSKWVETRRGLLAPLVAALQQRTDGEADFYRLCGLRPLPYLLRMRVLDAELRRSLAGLEDITVPLDQLASLSFPVATVLIVENQQTGLSFGDLPGTVVLMKLGYGVDVLGRIPWLAHVRSIYWGDLDTHGFAILDRARRYLPSLESILMDEETLLSHRAVDVRK